MQTEDKLCSHYDVCETLMPDAVAAEEHQDNHTYVHEFSRPSFSALCNILAWYRWLQTGPQNIIKIEGVGACAGMGICLRQYGITQMFKLFAKYIDCSKWRKFRYKICHWIVPATPSMLYLILPSSIHSRCYDKIPSSQILEDYTFVKQCSYLVHLVISL